MRLKQIHVDYHLVQEFFRQDAIHHGMRITKGIPADARLANVEFLDMGRIAAFTFNHDSFDDLSEGASIPVMDCEVERYAPIPDSLADLTQDDRQRLYIQLHDQYDCRRYK